MFESVELYKPEERRGVPPVEMQLAIQKKSDQLVKEYTSKNPAELTAEDYYKAFYEIETLKKMAEEFANEKLNDCLENAQIELKKHKKLSSQESFKDINSFKKVPDPRKPQIGTHR